MEFYSFWERRNVAHYMEPYRSYKEICQLSLSEAFRRFGVSSGREELIARYFECFPSMRLYPDVQPTLDILARNYRLALVSNIDDDLLNMTALGRQFDLVCTAERARGYKPDGTLFRYLIRESGLSVSQIPSACPTCPIKPQCTTGKERRIKRWEHEAIIDAMQRRLGCRSCENALAVCDRSAKDSDAMEGLSGDRASGPDRRHQGADTQDGNDAFEGCRPGRGGSSPC